MIAILHTCRPSRIIPASIAALGAEMLGVGGDRADRFGKGLSGIVCGRRFSSLVDEPFTEDDGELCPGLESPFKARLLTRAMLLKAQVSSTKMSRRGSRSIR
jgi:hypothetical protein